MAEPHWTSYVGMISGLIGIFIAGLSLKKVSTVKSLDLRLEIKKTISDIELNYASTIIMIEDNLKSRIAELHKQGMFHSSMMENYSASIDKDKNKMREILDETARLKCNFEKLNQKELESKLVDAYKIHKQLSQITEKHQR